MFSDIRRLAKHTSIYAVGNLLNKLAGFLLLPLYTNYLSPADYGTLELLLLAAPIISTALGSGLYQATTRFFFDKEEIKYRQKVVATSLYSSFLAAALGCFLLIQLSDEFSQFFFKDQDHSKLFVLVFYALFFELCMEVPLSYIRCMEYSLFFITVSFGRLLLAIALNITFLVYMDMGLVGILYSDVITAGIQFIFIAGLAIRFCHFNFSFSLLRKLIGYGWPLIFVGYGMMTLNLTDRYFLSLYTDLITLGLYSIALKFAALLSMGVIIPFWRGYGPFRFSIMKQDNAKDIYARMLTYYIFLVGWVGVGLALLTREALIVMTNESFWGAYPVVPLLILGFTANGIYYMTQTGIYIHKKTKYIGYIMNVVAIAKIIVAWFLVKNYGLTGAGISLVIGYALLASITYFVSQRIYYIQYEGVRIFKVITVLVLAYAVGTWLITDNIWITILLKLMLLITVPIIIYLLNILTDDEKNQISRGAMRLRKIFIKHA